MKITAYFLLTVLIIVTAFLLIDPFSDDLNKIERKEEIEHVFSFPKGKEKVLLSNPVNFTFSDSTIFISDWPSSSVFTFNLEGKFLNTYGGEGRGPNEFMQQNKIELDGDDLYVLDQGNRRLSIIDIEEDTNSVKPMRELFREYAVINGNIFSFLLNRSVGKKDLEDLDLIKVYDKSVNEIHAFGDYINYTGNMDPGASVPLIEGYNEKVYVLHMAFPVLKIFDTKGELLKTINFDALNANYKERVEINYESNTYSNPTKRAMTTFSSSFDVNKEGIFVNLHDDNLIIDHFNHDGSFKKRYETKIHANEHIIRDMEVRKSKDTLTFYVLNITNGYPRVNVYQPVK